MEEMKLPNLNQWLDECAEQDEQALRFARQRAASVQLESKLARMRETCDDRLEEYRKREAERQDARVSGERLWWKEGE
jgi:Rad3-related DNA helicase